MVATRSEREDPSGPAHNTPRMAHDEIQSKRKLAGVGHFDPLQLSPCCPPHSNSFARPLLPGAQLLRAVEDKLARIRAFSEYAAAAQRIPVAPNLLQRLAPQ